MHNLAECGPGCCVETSRIGCGLRHRGIRSCVERGSCLDNIRAAHHARPPLHLDPLAEGSPLPADRSAVSRVDLGGGMEWARCPAADSLRLGILPGLLFRLLCDRALGGSTVQVQRLGAFLDVGMEASKTLRVTSIRGQRRRPGGLAASFRAQPKARRSRFSVMRWTRASGPWGRE